MYGISWPIVAGEITVEITNWYYKIFTNIVCVDLKVISKVNQYMQTVFSIVCLFVLKWFFNFYGEKYFV